jgi:hypothetical protein
MKTLQQTPRRTTTLAAAAALALTGLLLGDPARAASTIDPSDAHLVPNPIESSDEGTAWTCRATGPEITCTGSLGFSWDAVEGPDDWCAVTLWSVDGSFTREQTRRYGYDADTGDYLEYKRLIHLDSSEHLAAAPDAQPEDGVFARLAMTWISTFGTPGDLGSRVTRKQGIDTFFQGPDGGAFILDVGQKKTIGSDDYDFRGRWDIALGDPSTEFAQVCAALGL